MKFNRLFSTILLQLISIAMFGNGNTVSHYDKAPLIDHLVSINKEWNKQKDIPTDLLTIPMKFNTDDERIQLHLKLVESILNKRSSDHLTVQQFINRKKNLKSLVEYWKEGQFPINTRHSHRQPYFIDDFGTACAVGHLLLTSGERQLAHHISNVQNYAYIHEMNYPELDEWANENGFTEDELAWIQPGYDAGNYCYSTFSLNIPAYSDINQPLSQQEIEVMMTLPDESMMIVGGSFLHYDANTGTQTASIFGYDGSSYISFGDAIQGRVYDIEYYDGKIYAAGDFVLSGTNTYNIAYWDGSDWVGVQIGNMNGIIRDIATYKCQLYVGGDFTMVNGSPVANLAIWDGTDWSTTPQNCDGQSAAQALQVNASVNTFEIYYDKLALGGAFSQANDTPVEGLIFLNDLTVELLPTHGSMTSVDHLKVYETALLIGADSLCAYRWNKWYYPSDTLRQWQLWYLRDGGTLQIPQIGRTNGIFYKPIPDGTLYNTNDYINHLVFSADNQVLGMHGYEGGVFYASPNYNFSVDGTVLASTRFNDVTYYGGNFNIVTMASNPSSRNDCDGGFSAHKTFSLQRIILLPVELAEFTVKSADNKTTLLQWTSQTEKNSLHYEIQRKVDDGDFMRVNTVAAAGESLEEIDYTYEDDISKINGKYVYYRLKMVDKDGSYEYSDIRSLKLRTIKPDISVSPNPAQNTVALDLQLALDETVMVNIYNLQGQQINSYTWAYTNTNSQRQIDVSHLLSGVYILEVASSQGRTTKKLDIIK